ncbi:chlorophyllide A oxygenase, chloroplastic, partial [Tanacetum coccineum]
EEEFHLATTAQLIRIQSTIKRDKPKGKEMYKKMEFVIKAKNDVVEARKIVKDNLDNLEIRLSSEDSLSAKHQRAMEDSLGAKHQRAMKDLLSAKPQRATSDKEYADGSKESQGWQYPDDPDKVLFDLKLELKYELVKVVNSWQNCSQKYGRNVSKNGRALNAVAFTPLSNLHISQLILSMGLYKFAYKLDTLSSLLVQKGYKGGFVVFAASKGDGEEGGFEEKKDLWSSLFDVEDPRSKLVPQVNKKFLDVNQAVEVARYDLQYCDWRARQDLLTIMLLHDKVVDVLNPLAREYKSIGTLKKDLAELQEELAQAHKQVHISEARVGAALDKLAYMETLVNDKLLEDKNTATSETTTLSRPTDTPPFETAESKAERKSIRVSGPVKPYHPRLKNFWYPVAFSTDLKDDTLIPIECFEEPWVLFRGKDGKPGCIKNTCAHRACPLDLGSVNEGRVQCPYHGWEYSADGTCEKMPSTKFVNVKIKSLTCIEHERMIWIWPGNEPSSPILPSLQPPPGFQIHAEIVMELPVEHGLLLDNLLDLAHAPFTHTSTFAKGWSVPSFVKFLTPESGLQGYWDPYPIDMEFRPPCIVLSTIGISKPGKLEGQSTKQCATHLHQLHVCLPSSRNKTRLLYRMSLDFAPLLQKVPFMHILWKHFAEKVLNEDLRLVLGQQDRMNNGANVWNWPVSYDKLGGITSRIHERLLRTSEDFVWPVDSTFHGRFIIDVEFLNLQVYSANGEEASSIWPNDGMLRSSATESILRCLSRMLHDSIDADVTINTGEGTLNAHKAILSASSPVFHSMFLHNLKEKESSTIDIQDMSLDSCTALLSYLYGTIKQEDFWKHRLALLGAANKYAISDLKDLCEESLLEDINSSNVLERLQEAWLYQLDKLKKGCLTYLFDFGKIYDIRDEVNDFFKNAERELIQEMFQEVLSVWKPA